MLQAAVLPARNDPGLDDRGDGARSEHAHRRGISDRPRMPSRVRSNQPDAKQANAPDQSSQPCHINLPTA